MPKVPIMSPEIRQQATPQVAEPEMRRPPPEAFGGDVAQATERMGGAVQNAGDMVFQRMMEQREREMAQQNLDVQTKAQTAIQDALKSPELDDNNMPKGVLNRTLNQAKGATTAYDNQAMQIKRQYMDMVSSPIQKQEMNRTLSTMLLSGREQVVSHEAQQTQAAFNDSFEKSKSAMVGNAAGIDDPQMLSKYITVAQTAAVNGWKHSGIAEKDLPLVQQKYAADILKSAIVPLAENNPKQAQAILDANKEKLMPEDAATLQNHVTGKMLDTTILDVFDKSKQFRMADGMIDRSKIDSFVNNLDLNPQQKLQVKMHVDRLAMVDYSEQMKIKQDQEKSFVNDAITAQSKGMPVELFMREAANPKYGNADPTTIANRQSEIAKLWSNPEERFNSWLSHSPQPTQHAWSDVQEMVKAKYGNGMTTVAGRQMKAADAAIGELKEDVMGKSADQIRDIADAKLKKVVIGPGAIFGNVWPNKAEGWKADAQNRENDNQKLAKLNSVYGQDLVFKAQQFLTKNGQQITPENIQMAISQVSGGNQ